MNLREQAREVVVRVCQDPMHGDHDLADAASDVWEPLVRELLEHHDAMCSGTECADVFVIRSMVERNLHGS